MSGPSIFYKFHNVIVYEDNESDHGPLSVKWHEPARPPLNKKLFPVHHPSGLKRAGWHFFFMFFEKSVFSSNFSVYPSL